MQAWRSQLGRFGLSGAHQTSLISQLSDGLRNRCASCFCGHFHLFTVPSVSSSLNSRWSTLIFFSLTSRLTIWTCRQLTPSPHQSSPSPVVSSSYRTTSVSLFAHHALDMCSSSFQVLSARSLRSSGRFVTRRLLTLRRTISPSSSTRRA
jgi:hypothetical protein